MDFSIEKLRESLSFEEPNQEEEINHFQAAVLVPFIKIDGEYHLLFEKRAEHIRQGGQISFPGGGVEEQDRNYEETALRETEEELLIGRENIEVFGNLPLHSIPNRAVVHPYIGEIKVGMDALNPSKDEVAYLFTVPITYFMKAKPQKLSRSVFLQEKANQNISEDRVIYLYKYKDENIWGLTAEIIVSLMEKLKEKEIRK